MVAATRGRRRRPDAALTRKMYRVGLRVPYPSTAEINRGRIASGSFEDPASVPHHTAGARVNRPAICFFLTVVPTGHLAAVVGHAGAPTEPLRRPEAASAPSCTSGPSYVALAPSWRPLRPGSRPHPGRRARAQPDRPDGTEVLHLRGRQPGRRLRVRHSPSPTGGQGTPRAACPLNTTLNENPLSGGGGRAGPRGVHHGVRLLRAGQLRGAE